MAFGYERPQILGRAERGIDRVVVRWVVLVVRRRGEDRGQPEAADAEPGEVPQLLADAGEIAAEERASRRLLAPRERARRIVRPIAIVEALGEDLVEGRAHREPGRTARASGGAPRPSAVSLSLHRTGGQAADELALQEEEQDDDRKGSDERRRRERAPLALVLTANEECQADGERVLVGALQERARQDEVGVGTDEGQKPDDDEDRPNEGHEDISKDLQSRGAVDQGRLVKRSRDRVEVALHQPGVEAEGSAGVDRDEPAMSVEP